MNTSNALWAGLDEDRLAKLYGALSQLQETSRTAARQAYLANALNVFHETVSIPALGNTAEFQNRQLHSLAYLGMAAAHQLLGDPHELVAEKMVLAVCADQEIAMRFLGDELCTAVLDRTWTDRIRDPSVTVSSDGHNIVGGLSGDIVIWDLHTGDPILRFNAYLPSSCRSSNIILSTWGDIVVSSIGDVKVKVWQLNSGEILHTLDTGHGVSSLDISSDGKLIISGGTDTVQIWDAETGRRIKKLKLPKHSSAISVASHVYRRVLVAGTEYKGIKIWNLETGKLMHTLDHPGRLFSISLSEDGKTMVSGGSDGVLRLWNPTHGGMKSLPFLHGHTGEVSATAVYSNLLIASADQETVRIWNLRNHFTLGMFRVSGLIYSLAFSPDGHTLVGADPYGVVKWQIPSEYLSKVKNSYKV